MYHVAACLTPLFGADFGHVQLRRLHEPLRHQKVSPSHPRLPAAILPSTQTRAERVALSARAHSHFARAVPKFPSSPSGGISTTTRCLLLSLTLAPPARHRPWSSNEHAMHRRARNHRFSDPSLLPVIRTHTMPRPLAFLSLPRTGDLFVQTVAPSLLAARAATPFSGTMR